MFIKFLSMESIMELNVKMLSEVVGGKAKTVTVTKSNNVSFNFDNMGVTALASNGGAVLGISVGAITQIIY
jgi:hypothetical protein